MSHNYTQEECVAIKVLSERLIDLELDDEQSSSANLIRWLRARDLNITKAEDMLRKSLEWRKENKVDLILEWNPPPIFHKIMPHGICGYDSEGCPIVIFPTKFNDMRIFWSCDMTEHLLYAIQNSEKFIQLMKIHSKIRQAVLIYDLEGFNLTTVMNRRYMEFSREMTSVMEANYPEMIKGFYVVNTPRIFTLFWLMLKPFLPTKTLSKIHIYGNNKEKWMSEIVKNVPADQLPPSYGGTNEEFERTAFKNCGVTNL